MAGNYVRRFCPKKKDQAYGVSVALLFSGGQRVSFSPRVEKGEFRRFTQ